MTVGETGPTPRLRKRMRAVLRDHLWGAGHPPKTCAKDCEARSFGVCTGHSSD